MVVFQVDVMHLLKIEVSATMYKDANVLTMGLQGVEAVSQNGISRQSGWVSIIFYQHIHIHLLYLLGHHPGKFAFCSIWILYSFWDLHILGCSYSIMVFQPFVDSDHFIHKYFLPQDYAILIPVFAGVTLLCFLCTFVGFVMLKSKQKAK